MPALLPDLSSLGPVMNELWKQLLTAASSESPWAEVRQSCWESSLGNVPLFWARMRPRSPALAQLVLERAGSPALPKWSAPALREPACYVDDLAAVGSGSAVALRCQNKTIPQHGFLATRRCHNSFLRTGDLCLAAMGWSPGQEIRAQV